MTRRRLVLVVLTAFVFLVLAPAAGAVGGERRRAQARTDRGGLIERLELDSLAEIPWDAFIVGLSISAALGAVGGVIYAGLRPPEEEGTS